MSNYAILSWQPLLRPPAPDQAPPAVPDVCLKALSCRNQSVSLMAVVTAASPVKRARVVFTDLACPSAAIPASNIRVRLVGSVVTPEKGPVCDPLYDMDEFDIAACAALHTSVRVPSGIPAATYTGKVKLIVDGQEVAANDVEVEVADVDLPDIHDWDFFLNVWMNPASVARMHGVEVWSEEHFELLRPYIRDLAEHGQKTAVVPICYQPWGTQTRDPYPSAVTWKKHGSRWEFDFSIFDRYVELHEEYGIDKAIHCYGLVQGPGSSDRSVIEYIDVETGEIRQIITKIGDEAYTQAWSALFAELRVHTLASGRLQKSSHRPRREVRRRGGEAHCF